MTLACPSRAYLHDGAAISGSFTAPDLGQTWSATFTGFDQADRPLSLAADHTFTMTVTAPLLTLGTFQVVVTVTDGKGGTGQASCTVVVVLKRVMLYLHGTTGTFKQVATRSDSDLPSLFVKLAGAYPFRFFRYYEDAGNRVTSPVGFSCQDGTRRDNEATIDPSSGMPIDVPPMPDPYPGICDSNDDVEINAALLTGTSRPSATISTR